MRTLRKGMEGDDVSKVQSALNAIFEEQLSTDGKFGAHTEEMVMVFQEDQGLKADGIVGPQTWAKLFNEEVADDDEPLPAAVIRQSQLAQLFGKPRDPAPYLKLMDFSEYEYAFSHVKGYKNNPWQHRVYGHQMMEAPLRAAFKALVDKGLAKELKSFDGCHNIRKMTSGGGMSVHSWGLAIDVNAKTNGYGSRPTLSYGFVKCFTDAGFEWGGGWRTPDGMHFQLPKTK